MSPAPTVALEESQPDEVEAYRAAVTRQNELINEGMSNSGRERNCCFLNSGNGRFANISAAAGLDHIGDGRAYALTDWDHDGDVDIWATNRTGPRAQFFLNNGVPGHHFLGLKLQGNGLTVNRDAIGARVELILPGSDEGRRIQVVRAGAGFVSQSSKALLFGLGRRQQIERLVVDWPGGDQEEFTGLEADRHYLIVEGSGRPRPWVRSGGDAELVAVADETTKESPQGRIQLRYRIPMPTIEYKKLDGTAERVTLEGSSPTLVNLWASWCQPCLRELADFRNHEQELRKRKLNILALSVDQLAENAQSNAKSAAALLSRQKFPFDAGFATDRLMQTLDAVHYFLYEVQRQTSVPTSMLFDAQGRLAVIYVGPLEMDQLLADVDQLEVGDLPWFESALPYAGIWLNRPPQPDLASLVDAFVDRGLAEEARQYFDRFGDVLAHNARLPDLLLQLGSNLGNEGDLAEASKRFQQAIDVDPQNAGAHLQLSRAYLLQQNYAESLHHATRAVELRPEFEEAHFVLASLYEHQGDRAGVFTQLERLVQLDPSSTKYCMLLGGVYARAQRWTEAVELFRRAVQSAPDRAETHYQLALALQESGNTAEAADAFEQVGRLDPNELKRQYMLAVGLSEAGNVDGAIEHFRLAQRLDPTSPFTMNALAWLLATRANAKEGDISEALRLALAAAESTKFAHPQLLDTLGAVYAASGDFDKAVSIANRAVAIADRANEDQLVAKIRSRLELYQRGEPYYLPGSEEKE